MSEKSQILCRPWIKKNCVFPPGSNLVGKVCGPHLLPFQIKILKDIEEGKSIFCYGGRKVSKSLLFAWALYFRLMTDTRAFICPLLASSEEQTIIIYKMILFQIQANPSPILKVRQSFIENNKTGSVLFRGVSRAGALFGYQPSAVCADELSNWKDFEVLEAVESGFGLSDKPPMRLYASNPPIDQVHPVLSKLKKCKLDSDFAVHSFSLGARADWRDKKNWIKVNPFLKAHYSKKGPRFPVLVDFYQKRFDEGLKDKSSEINFRRYQLGQNIYQLYGKWLDIDKIKTIGENIFLKEGITWSIGADISTSRDMTAFIIVGRNPKSGDIYYKPFIFLPTLEHRRNTHQFKFKKWHKEGHLFIQNKQVTNKKDIKARLKSYIDQKKIKISKLVIDQWRAENWYEDFNEWNLEKVAVSPRTLTMPIRELQRACYQGRLHRIGPNPCMDWHISNSLCSDQSKHWVSLKRSDNKEQNIDGSIGLCLGSSWLLQQKSASPKSFSIDY